MSKVAIFVVLFFVASNVHSSVIRWDFNSNYSIENTEGEILNGTHNWKMYWDEGTENLIKFVAEDPSNKTSLRTNDQLKSFNWYYFEAAYVWKGDAYIKTVLTIDETDYLGFLDFHLEIDGSNAMSPLLGSTSSYNWIDGSFSHRNYYTHMSRISATKVSEPSAFLLLLSGILLLGLLNWRRTPSVVSNSL